MRTKRIPDFAEGWVRPRFFFFFFFFYEVAPSRTHMCYVRRMWVQPPFLLGRIRSHSQNPFLPSTGTFRTSKTDRCDRARPSFLHHLLWKAYLGATGCKNEVAPITCCYGRHTSVRPGATSVFYEVATGRTHHVLWKAYVGATGRDLVFCESHPSFFTEGMRGCEPVATSFFTRSHPLAPIIFYGRGPS